MATIEHLRNSLIDKLMGITNKDYLEALNKLVEKSALSADVFVLSEAQLQMLQMSEDDIKNDRLVSQQRLDEDDLKWLDQL